MMCDNSDANNKKGDWAGINLLAKIFSGSSAALSFVVFLLERSIDILWFFILILAIFTFLLFWKPIETLIDSSSIRPLLEKPLKIVSTRSIEFFRWLSLAFLLIVLAIVLAPYIPRAYIWAKINILVRTEDYGANEKFTVLLADIHQEGYGGESNDPDPSGITNTLLGEVRVNLSNQRMIEVEHLGEYFNETQTYENVIRRIREEYSADILVWGSYTKSSEMTNLLIHFEVLRDTDMISVELRETGYTGMRYLVANEKADKFVLHNQLAGEISFLTLFVIGLTNYEEGNLKLAIAQFYDTLDQIEPELDRVVPLAHCEVYYYLGNAHLDSDEINAAIKNYTEAVELCPEYRVAYNKRGKAYSLKEDIREKIKAMPDFIKGSEIGWALRDSH